MQSKSRSSLWWIGAAAVLAWRLAAFVSPHQAFTDPRPVRLLSGVLGLVFLGCGAWVTLRASGAAARVFRLYTLAGALHWGGALALGSEAADLRILAFYLVVGVALAACLFVHLALVFPEPMKAAGSRGWLLALYSPVLAGGVLLLIGLVAGSSSLNLLGLLLPVSTLFGLVAGGVWIWRWAKADAGKRREQRLGWIVGTMLAAWLPGAVGSALGASGFLQLTNVAIPIVLAAAVVRRSAARGPD
jgi:hypothetical protein